MAMLSTPLDTAAWPMAMLSAPAATLSVPVLLAWKYFVPLSLILVTDELKEFRLLFVVLRPVLRLPTPLVAVLRPVEVEVDRLLILLFAVLRPVDVDVDKLPILL